MVHRIITFEQLLSDLVFAMNYQPQTINRAA